MKRVLGWWWPDFDEHACRVVPAEVSRLHKYMAHVSRNRVAVQAGGNVGVYPQALSEHFDRVITFEPDARNLECLRRNVTAPNVEIYEGALGAEPGHGSVFTPPHEAGNCGALAVGEGSDFRVYRLDDMRLSALDFLMLDVEGWEHPAVLGAEETIRTHRPTIALELKGLGGRFGWDEDALAATIESWGYEKVAEIGRDKVFCSASRV